MPLPPPVTTMRWPSKAPGRNTDRYFMACPCLFSRRAAVARAAFFDIVHSCFSRLPGRSLAPDRPASSLPTSAVPGRIHPAYWYARDRSRTGPNGEARKHTTPGRVPGRARRKLPHRLRRGVSRLRTAAVSDLRGRVRGGAYRASGAGHDSDRQFGGRSRRRHPSPHAAIGTAYRGGVVPAGTAPADGAEGRDAEDDQDGREPRTRARP